MLFAINDMTLMLKPHYIALDKALTTFIKDGTFAEPSRTAHDS